jgi:ketosteroid isomerase-like protein
MEQSKLEEARRILQQAVVWPDPEQVLDPGMRPETRQRLLAWYEALANGDLEWLLERTDPAVQVVQPPEVPGAKRFWGHEGFVEGILDWPLNWDDFRMEWKRTFERPDGRVVSLTHQHARGKEIAIEVEADVVLVTTWRDDGRLLRWEMFMGLDAEAWLQPPAEIRSGAP